MEKALSWEIDDFSKRNNWIKSDNFSSGGCEWYATMHPKGSCCSDHLSLFLHVVNPYSLRPGWKRRAIFSFVLLNQSGQVLNRSPGFPSGQYCLTLTGPIPYKPENQRVKTKYMYLLGLIETLSKPPESLSATELSNAQRDLTALKETGFELDWLNSKLEELSLEWKKAEHSDEEEEVENVELPLSDLVVELDEVGIKSDADATAQVSSFQFIGFLIKRFFLSCFLFSKS